MRLTGIISFLISLFFTTQNVYSQNPAEAPVVNYKILGAIQTKSTHEISSSNWSVGGETLGRNYTDYKSWSPHLEELGIKKVRLQGGWAKCEKEIGIYEWAWLDEVIFDLPTKGIIPYVCLCYGNPLYGKGETKLGSKIDVDKETMTAWLNWVEAFVTRYKGVVNEWEIWNEPNGHNEPETYANLLIPTAELIRKLQPSSKILAFSLAGVDIKFAEGVLMILKEKDKTDLVDYLTYHPYRFNPDRSYNNVEALQDLVKSYTPDMKLYQDENGAPSEWRRTKALRNYEWSELTQSKWALRRMLGDLGRDIPSSIFSIIDLKYPDEMNRKGLLYANEDKTFHHRKKSYYAVQNLASVFDDQLERIRDFECTASTNQNFAAFAYKQKITGNNITVIWLNTNRPTDYNATQPLDVKLKGVNYKNAVWVDLRTGLVYELPKKSIQRKDEILILKGLAVYDSPVLVAEKGLIQLR